MFHNINIPENCINLWKICHSLVPDLLENSTIKTCNLRIKANQPIDPTSKSVYLIKEGTINEKHEGHTIVIHDTGDLIGADGLLQQKTSTFVSDFAIVVDEYDGQQLLEEIFNDKNKFLIWNQYLSCLLQSYQLIMCHLNKQDIDFNPEYRHYSKGDIIIQEGSEGSEVFTLMSGFANVIVNNTQVGEINRDEIFGAIAALTSTKRNASIIAASDCETIVVKSDSFKGLLSARPDTVQHLINDMARTIVSCNDKILDLSKDKAQ